MGPQSQPLTTQRDEQPNVRFPPIADVRETGNPVAMLSVRLASLLSRVLVVATLLPTHAQAISTRCSNPQREGMRGSGTIKLAWSELPKFDAWLQRSERTLGMSYSSVESGLTGQPFRKKTIILQSAKSSVVIDVVARRTSALAEVTVKRTCFDDSLEPWRPYWRRFRAMTAAQGYPVLTAR